MFLTGSGISKNQTMKYKYLAFSILTLITVFPLLAVHGETQNSQVKASYNVLGRILPGRVNDFILNIIEKDGNNDVFEIESKNNRIM